MQKHGIYKNIKFVLSSIHRYDQSIIRYVVAIIVLSTAYSLAGIFFPKIVIDAILNKDKSTMGFVALIGGYTIMLASMNYLLEFARHMRNYLNSMIQQGSSRDIFYKGLNCRYEYFEDTDKKMIYSRIKSNFDSNEKNSYNIFLTAATELSISILGFLLYTVLLSSLNIYIVLLVILTSSVYHYMQYIIKQYENKIKDSVTKLDRKLSYLFNATSDNKNGKDIRLFHMREMLGKLIDMYYNQKEKLEEKLMNRMMAAKMVNALSILIRDGIAYFVLIYKMLHGDITVSDFMLYFGTIMGLSGFITQFISNSSTLERSGIIISEAYDYMNGEEESASYECRKDMNAKIAAPSPDIRFENIDFAYSTGNKILNTLSFTIHAGEKLAIVGENGAGKTTIINLLCGLYKPSSGNIWIGDKKTSHYTSEELMNMFSVVFQDYVILPFTLGENVAADYNYNTALVNSYLKTAGLQTLVEADENLPLRTMSRHIDPDGVELSGGQIQKVLMARALLKDAPILILDEPTAALDPIAESEIYQNYKELTKGKTSIFISHRLASTRFCDKILLLKNGGIAEMGTHDELMNHGGEYAHMYYAQSHYYKEDMQHESMERFV